jgi:hypothetical protein
MKKQISFDDEILITTIHAGNYRRDDGDQDEYVEGNYPFEIRTEFQTNLSDNDDMKPKDFIIAWTDKKPFRHLIEQQKIEEKIINKYKKSF